MTREEYTAWPARFWAKVHKTESCWFWIGGASHSYGTILYQGKRTKAHRISWMLAFGKPPAELDVLHRCDNPRCVNPDHLFLGTALDNMRDSVTELLRKNLM
jgi:hypothetical protein